jgi:glycosyltransferase involved in cell wall biosynthesis
MRIAIFHNILWSKYKGKVFSALHELTQSTTTHVRFTQIAETEGDRISLSGVDLSYHTYPFELVFKGSYSSIPTHARILAMAKRAWQAKEDVVVLPGYDRLEYWAMLIMLVIRRKPRAVFCDSTAYDRPHIFWKSLAKRIFFWFCNGFFGYGSRSRDYLVMHGVDRSKIFYRCQAAALPHTYNEQLAIEMRTQQAPKLGASPQFLYVGRLSTEKGLDTLVTAMCTVVEKFPNAQLNIVGAGPLEKLLRTWVEQQQLTHNVSLLGSMGIEQLEAQYAKATALILPSTSEPWGLVVNEALSFGCPVIVSNACGCVPELVIDGVTGYEFQTGNQQELAQRMLQISELTVSAHESASNCVQFMRRFTPQKAAEQILSGCEQILQIR